MDKYAQLLYLANELFGKLNANLENFWDALKKIEPTKKEIEILNHFCDTPFPCQIIFTTFLSEPSIEEIERIWGALNLREEVECFARGLGEFSKAAEEAGQSEVSKIAEETAKSFRSSSVEKKIEDITRELDRILEELSKIN